MQLMMLIEELKSQQQQVLVLDLDCLALEVKQ
jgi:hypothetical protein